MQQNESCWTVSWMQRRSCRPLFVCLAHKWRMGWNQSLKMVRCFLRWWRRWRGSSFLPDKKYWTIEKLRCQKWKIKCAKYQKGTVLLNVNRDNKSEWPCLSENQLESNGVNSARLVFGALPICILYSTVFAQKRLKKFLCDFHCTYTKLMTPH